ncbi:MAG TPA: hypothetical protein PLE16_14735 [Spirochaetota bacterium]|nr:hypothetical protein [Spirochaetota bacterium]HPJ16487.1 hypothetical protein [Spirochaetota bacterium]HPM35844.1 hypothetical protein [Spirochaetota bacterium]HPY04269.1 hypothetical protein [Spirochaetota bacterium]HQE57821.1 hypothetical protein [Spirochaetota bacterium]
MKSKISSAGGFLFLLGIASIVMYFIGFVPKILVWIDMWGETIGWAIRIGITVLGGLLFLVSTKMKD